MGPKKYSNASGENNLHRLRQLVQERPEDTLEGYARELGLTANYVGALVRRYNLPYQRKQAFRQTAKPVPKPRKRKKKITNQQRIMLVNAEALRRGMTYGQLVATGYKLEE